MYTFGEIRRISDEVLCDKCRPLYIPLIEPTVKAMMAEFFHDWQGVEANVRFILAYHSNAFKGPPYPFDVGREDVLDAFSDTIDIEIYDDIRKRFFKTMVDDLLLLRIINVNLHGLLVEVAKRRNQIHRYKVEIPESDRIVFFKVHQLLWRWSLWIQDGHSEEQLRILTDAIEREAGVILADIKPKGLDF